MTGFKWLGICGLLATQAVAAEPASMLELQLKDAQFVGTIAAKNTEYVWLLQRDGRLDRLAITDVIDYRPLSDKFAPYPAADFRDRLVREFGAGYEVAGSIHYLVVARKGAAKRFVSLFEDLYRQLHVYLAARGFRIHEPKFPLVAIVLPTPEKFVEYCEKERVKISTGLRGFYIPGTNRVALYETGEELDDTVIHEAVHQVAFNLGLHRRMGENPLWLVEGLATALEPENFRKPLPSTPLFAKVNRERFVHFRNFAAERRSKKSLTEFVCQDDLFQSAPLDAYSQAWALTFFLLETRQAQFADYLRKTAARPVGESYGPEERLADFQKFFGKDLTLLEADFLRFMTGLGR